jgi:hypothetical protein
MYVQIFIWYEQRPKLTGQDFVIMMIGGEVEQNPHHPNQALKGLTES